jgi:formylglycine-generating enzyme required for sulfatase activity
MGQGGTVWEWNETAYDGSNNTAGENRQLRGGSWDDPGVELVASARYSGGPTYENGSYGFRVAMVPEPSALSLLAVGLGVVLRRRRRTV